MSEAPEKADGSPAMARAVLDSHVHLHPIYDQGHFLDAAIANARVILPNAALAWLLLTEMAVVDSFAALVRRPPAGWDAAVTADGLTLELYRQDGAWVRLTAGRQVQTKEGLELLALGTRELIPDGIAFGEAVRRAQAAGALAVAPWGVGKWLGQRGRLLADFLAGPTAGALYLGDSASRPTVWPAPSLFATASAAGRRVLPGTDPLPLPRHVDRVARFGLGLEIDPTKVDSFAALTTLIADPTVVMTPCGARSSVPAFIIDQTALRMAKGRRRAVETSQ